MTSFDNSNFDNEILYYLTNTSFKTMGGKIPHSFEIIKIIRESNSLWFLLMKHGNEDFLSTDFIHKIHYPYRNEKFPDTQNSTNLDK